MRAKQAATISCVILKYIHNKTFDDLLSLINLYQSLSPDSLVGIKSEFFQWKNKQLNISNQNSTVINESNSSTSFTKRNTIVTSEIALDSFNKCTATIYLYIKVLLLIFATLPVIEATSERSFSLLKLIKNYIRTTISETQLNELTLMYIYIYSGVQKFLPLVFQLSIRNEKMNEKN